jgi:hypothetical protein
MDKLVGDAEIVKYPVVLSVTANVGRRASYEKRAQDGKLGCSEEVAPANTNAQRDFGR